MFQRHPHRPEITSPFLHKVINTIITFYASCTLCSDDADRTEDRNRQWGHCLQLCETRYVLPLNHFAHKFLPRKSVINFFFIDYRRRAFEHDRKIYFADYTIFLHNIYNAINKNARSNSMYDTCMSTNRLYVRLQAI